MEQLNPNDLLIYARVAEAGSFSRAAERLGLPKSTVSRRIAQLEELLGGWRRTKATLIYKRTKNLRAIQLLRGHSTRESTVRYLGIEVDDTLEISEQTEI